jgi:hypothetical protein
MTSVLLQDDGGGLGGDHKGLVGGPPYSSRPYGDI